jgi:hypothetical protein
MICPNTGTTSCYLAAAQLSEDPVKAEIYRKQCLTSCLLQPDLPTCRQLVMARPDLAWGLALTHIHTMLHNILTTNKSNSSTEPLLSIIHRTLSEEGVNISGGDLASLQEFVRTTRPAEMEAGSVLVVSGHVAEAYLTRDQPQVCLAALAKALAVLQQDVRNIRLVKAIFPKG